VSRRRESLRIKYYNDEIIFIIPAMDPGQKFTYRVTNTAKDSAKRVNLDIVNNPNNLLENADFEKGDDKSVAAYSGQGKLDKEVKRSGSSSMVFAGNKRMACMGGHDGSGEQETLSLGVHGGGRSGHGRL
jgi:hypothetical protein